MLTYLEIFSKIWTTFYSIGYLCSICIDVISIIFLTLIFSFQQYIVIFTFFFIFFKFRNLQPYMEIGGDNNESIENPDDSEVIT